MFEDRRLPAVDRPAAWRATVLAMLLLAAIPAAAQARTFNVDGRVTGPPAARGGAVTVPVQLTKRAGAALNFGTRNVGVRLSRRARLPLSGAGASAARLTPTALRAGDRVKGVTSLSRRARQRLRWYVRPTLKLKRVRVIRPAIRVVAPPGAGAVPAVPGLPGLPAFPGSSGPGPLGPVVASLEAQTNALAPRGDEAGPVSQEIDARRLQLESVKTTGLEGVKNAFEGLKTALEALDGQVDEAALEAVLANREALSLRVEALKDGIGPLESTLGELEGALSKVRGAAEKLVPSVASLAAQVALIQQTPGAPALVGELEATATRLNGRLDTAQAALDSFAADTGGLVAGLASLASSIDALATAAGSSADLASLSAGVNGLAPAIAGLEGSFGSLQATGGALTSTAEAIEADAILVETTVGSLCSLVSTACP